MSHLFKSHSTFIVESGQIIICTTTARKVYVIDIPQKVFSLPLGHSDNIFSMYCNILYFSIWVIYTMAFNLVVDVDIFF